ncbi:hypothetical protein [Ornithinibacillus halophilus]|nr:hypothetical protein [Ornithinibacillus halophilus]
MATWGTHLGKPTGPKPQFLPFKWPFLIIHNSLFVILRNEE